MSQYNIPKQGIHYSVHCLICDYTMYVKSVDWDRATCAKCQKISYNPLRSELNRSLTKVSVHSEFEPSVFAPSPVSKSLEESNNSFESVDTIEPKVVNIHI